MSRAAERSDPRLACYLERGEFRFQRDGWAALVEVSPWVSMKEELKGRLGANGVVLPLLHGDVSRIRVRKI